MSYFYLNLKSENIKTGPIPVSTSSRDTCPPSCPFNNGNGCYGDTGPMRFHWDKVSSGERGGNILEFCEQIQDLPANQLWRHNQAGDLPGKGEDIDGPSLKELIRANYGRRGYTYTHKYNSVENRVLIGFANQHEFTINLSANSPEHADELLELGIGPVMLVLSSWEPRKKFRTRADNMVYMCPAVYLDVTCEQCRWCQSVDRKFIIGVRAHGAGYTIVNEACGYVRRLF